VTRIAPRPLIAGLSLWLLLAVPPLRIAMEGTMVTHALQMGLLAAAGGLLARGFGPVRRDEQPGYNRFGITGTLLALLTLAFWLLPVSLDRALDHAGQEFLKFASLPLLLGLPLGRSWSRLPPVARSTLWANAVPMAAVMGWLYREAPVRLCTNYLVNDQQQLGLFLWAVAVVIASYRALRALIGFGPPAGSEPPP